MGKSRHTFGGLLLVVLSASALATTPVQHVLHAIIMPQNLQTISSRVNSGSCYETNPPIKTFQKKKKETTIRYEICYHHANVYKLTLQVQVPYDDSIVELASHSQLDVVCLGPCAARSFDEQILAAWSSLNLCKIVLGSGS